MSSPMHLQKEKARASQQEKKLPLRLEEAGTLLSLQPTK
jgi:hypothetical protein